jgi:hypothetical protein
MTMASAVALTHLAGSLGHNHGARVDGHLLLHAGAHHRAVGPQQGHGLALHVAAHERTVGVVVLQERNQLAAAETICLGDTSM